MNKTTIDVYAHYKSLHPSTLFLFRVGNNYEAYIDDAVVVNDILPCLNLTPVGGDSSLVKVTCDHTNILDVCESLSNNGRECRLIQSRNQNGSFDLPEINSLIEGKEIDY